MKKRKYFFTKFVGSPSKSIHENIALGNEATKKRNNVKISRNPSLNEDETTLNLGIKQKRFKKKMTNKNVIKPKK